MVAQVQKCFSSTNEMIQIQINTRQIHPHCLFEFFYRLEVIAKHSKQTLGKININ